MHQPAEKRTGRHDDRAADKLEVQIRAAPGHAAALKDEPGHGRLEHLQVRLKLQRVLQPELVGLLIALGPRGLDGRALGFIQ